MENEYKGLFDTNEQTKETQTTSTETNQTTPHICASEEGKVTSETNNTNIVSELFRTIENKVQHYIDELKKIEQQQQELQNKVIQQYKDTLSSELTDDKLKSIIFKGVK